MRRTITILAAATLALAACGDDDDSADDVPAEPAESLDGASDDSDDGGSTNDMTSDDPSEDSSDEASDGQAESDSASSGGGSIGSINDIPPRCRDLMAEFLQDIEPVVGQLDWQTATAQDFEQIAPEFEQFASEFDANSTAEECDDLDLDDDSGFELIIEFAGDVAPGTVSFFEFLDDMRAALPTSGGDDSSAGGTGDADTIETCDQMISGLRDLMNEYESFDQMPLSEITKYAGIGTVMMSCTPEQLELLDSDEFGNFLNG